jgi:hypothetical protein
VYALKITSIEALGAGCPRHGGGLSGGLFSGKTDGEAGCGACSIDVEFCLNRETNLSGAKDTSSLLAAGAKEVWWLRSLRSALEQGYTAFCEAVQPESPEGAVLSGETPPAQAPLFIAESNSLRRIIRPALFIMLYDNHHAPKETARDVMNDADIILPPQPDEASIIKILETVRFNLSKTAF